MSEELKAEEFDERTEEFDEEEQERMRRRRERIRRMKQEKERRLRLQRICKFAVPVAAVVLAFGIGALVHVVSAKGAAQPEQQERGENIGEEEQETQPSGQLSGQISKGDAGAEAQIVHIKDIAGQNDQTGEDNAVATVASAKVYAAHTTAQTAAPPDEVNSKYAVFIDLESGDILAQRDYLTVITPASMTKVLTVLVAAEQVEDLDDTFTVTIDITDYSYSNGCSSVGFAVGETVTVRDLFYGTILPSGGDAAVALATYVAGSHEAFVEMMNEKAEELGLSDTAHFTNCVGLYDENHHCTVYDMAMIMEAALDNELCREVLNARIYTTSTTKEHPEGITISNWFLRKIEDKDTGGEIVCAKTGYVLQSDSCAVSYGVDKSGRGYVCATAGAHSSWRCIYDHVALYKKYAQE